MKKVLAMLLVLALGLSAVALAEEAIGSPVPLETTYFTPEGITPTVKLPEQDPVVQQLLDAIAQSDTETVFASAGVDGLGDYELVELIGLALEDYDETMGPVTLNIRFPSAFATSDKLAVLLGLIDAESNVAWQSLSFQIEENGTLTITLTPEQATAVTEGTAVVAVLKAKTAE